MTGESPRDALDDDAMCNVGPERLTELTVDELMALKAAYECARCSDLQQRSVEVVGPLMAAVGIYSKTFLETLAKHDAEEPCNRGCPYPYP